MTERFRYRHSGVVVDSVLELPEWAAFAVKADGPADVLIDLADTPLAGLGEDAMDVVDGALRFSVPDVGGWSIEDGRRITLHPDPSAEPEQLRLFTLGSAWGALGYQRGHAMWHGSAVERHGRAVLLCGDAGEGKSTFAAALVAEGGRLVADDLSRIEPRTQGACIHPSSMQIKLWLSAIERLGWQDRIIRRDWLRDDKFHCSAPAHAAAGPPAPLVAVVVLNEGDEIGLERLIGSEALKAVVAGTIYRPEMIEMLGRWGEQAKLAAQITAQCPIYRLTRPKDFAMLDHARSAVADLWER